MISYSETIKELFSLESLGIRPGLKSTLIHLNRLGNPHKDYTAIHIAGTNGKGSTGAACEAVLASAGYSAGLYTSPHLIKFNERIRTNGTPISNKEIVSLYKSVKKNCLKSTHTPTFFEFATLMAFQFFKEQEVDIAVIETGLGGRLDSTNVILPAVSVITNIARDHTALLGSTIEKIAKEKAGIIKEGVACVTAVSSKRALRVIRCECARKSAPLFIYGKDFFTTPSVKGTGYFDYHGITGEIKNLKSSLKGGFQVVNSACALAALETLADKGFKCSVKAVREGLKGVNWLGRLEVVSKRPLFILDSAHNSAAAQTLAKELKEFKYNRLIVVTGIMKDKEIKGILRHITSVADTLILTRPEYYRAAETTELLASINRKSFNGDILECGNVGKACDLAFAEASAKDAIVVTGSIFTLGEAKSWYEGRALNL